MLDGDFSKLVDGAGQPIIIYDPLTGQAERERTKSGSVARDPCHSPRINIIPLTDR